MSESTAQPMNLRSITATATGNNSHARVMVTTIGLPESAGDALARTAAAAHDAFVEVWGGPPASVDTAEGDRVTS